MFQEILMKKLFMKFCRELREPPMGDEASRNLQYQEAVTTYSSFLKVIEEETVSPELRGQEEEQ